MYRISWIIVLAMGLSFTGWGGSPAAAADDDVEVDPTRYQQQIEAFEAEDAKQMPEPGALLFVGSSSIRSWDLERWFPDRPTINRGFGGSHMSDAIHYAERIIHPYEPRAIILYEGDNDIADGKSPARVLRDYIELVAVVRDELPDTPIIFISIKPSTARWELAGDMALANAMIRRHARARDGLHYLDVFTPMLDPDTGRPREQLLADDGLHMTEAGYELWTTRLKEKFGHLLDKSADR